MLVVDDATDGAEALKAAAPDIVILDRCLPDMDGRIERDSANP